MSQKDFRRTLIAVTISTIREIGMQKHDDLINWVDCVFMEEVAATDESAAADVRNGFRGFLSGECIGHFIETRDDDPTVLGERQMLPGKKPR